MYLISVAWPQSQVDLEFFKRKYKYTRMIYFFFFPNENIWVFSNELQNGISSLNQNKKAVPLNIPWLGPTLGEERLRSCSAQL